MCIIYIKKVDSNKIISFKDIEIKYHNNFINYKTIKDINIDITSLKMKLFFAKNKNIILNKYNKPLLDKGYFNISHDNEICVGVYDNNNSVGIYIIYLKRNDNILELKNIFNPDEPCDIFQWARKEAFSKLLGYGLFMNFLDIKIIDNVIF